MFLLFVGNPGICAKPPKAANNNANSATTTPKPTTAGIAAGITGAIKPNNPTAAVKAINNTDNETAYGIAD